MFMGYTPESQEMYNFFQNLGYTLIFKPMTGAPGWPQKGNVDAELVLQAMIDFESYHQAVIISGDGDFACLVRYLYSKEKLETLIVPDKRRYSGLLKHAAREKILSFNPLKRELAYTFRTRTPKKTWEQEHKNTPEKEAKKKPYVQPKRHTKHQENPGLSHNKMTRAAKHTPPASPATT